MKVAFFSTHAYDKEFFELHNDTKTLEFTYFESPLTENTVNLCQGFDAICVFVNDKLTAHILVQLQKNGVKLIALRCAGFNNIDLKSAIENNIKVVRVPAYSPNAVAEHTVALILTLNRKTHKAYNRVREGNFSLERLMGFDLNNKIVGVIGTGKIGAIFCKIMLGFGCEVIAYDMLESPILKDFGVKYVSLDKLLKQSDVISLHCPLTPQTQYLVNKITIEKMKDGVMLINTSRGGLINTKDAIHALKSEKIGYLGLDVYEQEGELFFNDLSENIIKDEQILRLMSFPNVLVTAHQGFFTKEAMSQIAQITIKNILDFNKGASLPNEVKVQ